MEQHWGAISESMILLAVSVRDLRMLRLQMAAEYLLLRGFMIVMVQRMFMLRGIPVMEQPWEIILELMMIQVLQSNHILPSQQMKLETLSLLGGIDASGMTTFMLNGTQMMEQPWEIILE